MQVIDLFGRLINNQEVNPGQQIKLGETFRTGIYYVRIMQGAESKDIKLVKLSR